MNKILSNEQLKGFERYKYKSIDTCILSKYVMHPFWDWCVQFCPLWVAPNLLTFAGFLLTVVNFLLLSYYDYGFNALTDDNHIPRWVFAISAVNLFLAYTLDGIDGKQARRTGTSGPLGELFDHGLDSFSTVLIPMCLYSLFGRNQLSPLRFFYTVWNVFINFYLTHWEKYNTGIMFLPWGYDFTMNGTWMMLIFTAVLGPEVWNVRLLGGFTPGVLFEIMLYVTAIITSQTIILWNIYKSYRDRTGKMRPFSEAIRPLIPIFILFGLSGLWAHYSKNDIITRDPRMFYVLTGCIFSNINCRLIVAQMSDTRCEAFNPLLRIYVPATLAMLLLSLSAAAELMILTVLCAVCCLSHIYYGACVVRQLAAHFNIECFKIKPKETKNTIAHQN